MKKTYKILVVDDTEATRYAIVRTLNSFGFTTIEASHGETALRMALTEKPDLVTLDIHLPDILGFEVCRRLKSNPATAHIPVLQVSASYVTSRDRIHGLEGGADSYLTHPFEPTVLLATVKALLRSRQLTEDLRLSEERFRVALKNAPLTISTCDLDLRYMWVYNVPAPLRVEDIIGKRAEDLMSPRDAAAVTALKRKALAEGEGQQGIVHVSIGAKEKVFDVTVEPLRSVSGDIVGLTVASVEVTDRVNAESAQRRATEEAELANQAKSRFLSNMSHEIRTPLGVIQGFADLALDPSLDPDEREVYLMTIKRNAQSLTKLLGEILDLSKIEAGRLEIETLRFSLRDLVSDVIMALSLQAKEKGIILQFEGAADLPEYVTSDPTRIRQILMNLISNALKFTSSGGVEVTAGLLPASAQHAHAMVEFRFQDSGIGLNAEQKARIFQPFSQADSSTTRKFGGSGLGLNLSRKLAHSLGGELQLVESEWGQGSVFSFTFDAGTEVAESAAVQGTERREEPSSPPSKFAGLLPGMKVLLVEDSIDNQILFTHYLKQTGAAVDIASDGIEGVMMAKKGAYDIILMDVQMPNLDGHDATLQLRAAGVKIPIVALTAHALKEERNRAFANGFSDYLTKPLSPTLLIETLSRYRGARPLALHEGPMAPH